MNRTNDNANARRVKTRNLDGDIKAAELDLAQAERKVQIAQGRLVICGGMLARLRDLRRSQDEDEAEQRLAAMAQGEKVADGTPT